MGSPFEDWSCIWEEMKVVTPEEDPEEEKSDAMLCHHPLMHGFCDWCDVTELEFNNSACPYYKAVHEPSDIEEEVRQYLEYTEDIFSVQGLT